MVTTSPDCHGAHQPVLLNEAIANLSINAEGTYVDGTYGRGGHARAILEHLSPIGRLIVMDRDPEAIAHAKKIFAGDERVKILHSSFSQMKQQLQDKLNISSVDGILLDLGVSSPQLDAPERGFSFMRDGPLDMRMNPQVGQSAADWLAEVPESELTQVIFELGEERYSRQIARAIVAIRPHKPIKTTKQLAELVSAVVTRKESGKHPATRTFQAIRIFINQELNELSVVLPQCTDLLKTGGRLVVINFHSLEDRITKLYLKSQAVNDPFPRDIPIKQKDLPMAKLKIIGKSIRADTSELDKNVRARSAILRTAEKQ